MKKAVETACTSDTPLETLTDCAKLRPDQEESSPLTLPALAKENLRLVVLGDGAVGSLDRCSG